MGEMIPPYNHLKAILNPKKGVLGIWIDPVDDKLVSREIHEYARISNVQTLRIPGYWYHQRGQPILGEASAVSGECVIYYIHGGGFIHQSAHPADLISGSVAATLKGLKSIRRLLSVEYRLTTGPPVAPLANPFPAALLDVLSGYFYLVNELKFDPTNVIIAGDSCGANLALALVRSLQATDASLPKGLILYSPWADPGYSHMTPGSSVFKYKHIDYASDYVLDAWAAETYTTPFGKEFLDSNPYVSPASKLLPNSLQSDLFKGFPKTLILAGDHEQLIDSIRTFKTRLERDIGKDAVTYFEIKDAVHDIIVFHWFQPEWDQAVQHVTDWYSTLY